MALSTPSTLTSGSNTTNSSSHTTASISPTGDALLLACFAAAANQTSMACTSVTDTFTGTGSWTIVTAHAINGLRRISITIAYAIAGSTPGSGTVTFNFDNLCNRNNWGVFEVTGHDTTTPVAQNKTNTANSSSTLTVTLDSSPNAASMVFGAIADHNGDATISAGTGFTELIDIQDGGGGFNSNLQVQYDLSGADTTCDWTSLAANDICYGAAIEISEAAAAGGDPEGKLISGKLTGGGILIKGRLV